MWLGRFESRFPLSSVFAIGIPLQGDLQRVAEINRDVPSRERSRHDPNTTHPQHSLFIAIKSFCQKGAQTLDRPGLSLSRCPPSRAAVRAQRSRGTGRDRYPLACPKEVRRASLNRPIHNTFSLDMARAERLQSPISRLLSSGNSTSFRFLTPLD